MKIKISIEQISVETNRVDKKISQFEFLSCAWSISSKYTEKNRKIFTQCIEIRSNSIKIDNSIASLSARVGR